MQLFRRPGINHVVRTMVYSDFLLISGTGFLAPIAAIFITSQIKGATVATVGFVTTVYWVVKSAVQVPVAASADARRGERDDFKFLFVGALIAATVPLLYFFATEVWHLFALEAINGVAFALQVPTWLSIFTRHIDRRRENTEWALHSNAVGLGYAAAAAIGGVLAERFGFRIIFLLVSGFMYLGAFSLLAIRRDLMDGDGADAAEGYAQTRDTRTLT